METGMIKITTPAPLWRGRVQFITHQTEKYSYLDSARIALEGGCQWVQLRMKDATPDEIRPVAQEVLKLCQQHNATFIIDDHVDLVKEIHANGVHLGKNDMPIEEAREQLGFRFYIGGTANTLEDMRRISSAGADYIGCGPFRYTTTKKNLSPLLGLEGLRTLIQQKKKTGILIPVVTIGGITTEDIPDILTTGVNGIALSGSVLRAAHPVEEMKRIMKLSEAFKV